MRLRSASADCDALGLSSRVGVEGSGIRGRIRRFFGGNRSPTNATASDGGQLAAEEEPEVIFTFKDCLETEQFLEASQLLIEQETSLFMHKDESMPLQDWDLAVDKLHTDYMTLEGAILKTIHLSLNPEDVSAQALTSAVTAVCAENEQDNLWMQRQQEQKPNWRPCKMQTKHDNELKRLIEERMDNPTVLQTSPVSGQASMIQNDMFAMGRQIGHDLGLVVERVRMCYPQKMDICNFYAAVYHHVLSSRLHKISEFGLDDKDCTFLLRWVNEFYPQLLQKPHLCEHIQTEALGKLLPPSLLEPLEEQYLSKQQTDMSLYISKVLDEARQMWSQGEMPKTEDGCYISDTAFHIIQFVNGAMTSTETVLADRTRAQCLTLHLQEPLQSYKSFLVEVIRSNRSNSGPTIKANLHCIQQFIDFLVTKTELFPEEVRRRCLSVLGEMQKSAHSHFLSPVHAELKAAYRKLGSDWLKGPHLNSLLENIESKSVKGLTGLVHTCQQELMGQLHLEVTVEFVKRLLKGDKLKDAKKQHEAYTSLKRDADSLHKTFRRMGSKEEWLKDVLVRIGELLKLQDLAAIQMHVVSMATTNPDISEKHVSAILKLKSNFSKANRQTVKETLRDALNESPTAATTTTGADNSQVFFSLIPL